MSSVHSVSDIQDAIRTHDSLLIRGGGSKSALSQSQKETPVLDLSALSDIVEYDPSEYTFTARAGTKLAEVEAALAEHGQYMPFDPPMMASGATLGGTVAAGLSGSGRYRYGGVRDFLIGVRFVDGKGQLVRGGGKVVKNAAGFDLPKLMVGSLGRFGVLTEVSFKVFPQPKSYRTLRLVYPDLQSAITAVHRLSAAPFDVDALDIVPSVPEQNKTGCVLLVRQGGLESVLARRTKMLADYLNTTADGEAATELGGEEEQRTWQGAGNFMWRPAEHALVKAATVPNQLVELDARLAEVEAQRRYCVGGNLSWIAWPAEIDQLDRLLRDLSLSGLVISGPPDRPLVGVRKNNAFAQRIKEALDPDEKFLTI